LEKGVREQLQNGGPLGGYKYPVTDVKITLVDGKMHSVDSKDITCQPADNLQGDIGSIVPRNEG
jgi:elongation factor G